MRPLFKYFGSKWQLSARYPKPLYDTIVEPFAGSACYSLRHHERNVVLVEADTSIAGLWRWLIKADPDEIRALPCELEPGADLRSLGLRHEAADLIRRWQRTGQNTCWTVSVWNGKHTGLWHPRTREAIAQNVQLIRHWTVIDGDYRLASGIGKATWFLDPPYQRIRNVYGYGERVIGSGFDYPSLAEWAKEREGQVIVCEQEGADWLPFEPFSSARTMRSGHNQKDRKRSSEVIWTR